MKVVANTKKRMITTIDIKTYKKLEDVAAADNRSVSNYVVKLIEEHLKSKGK